MESKNIKRGVILISLFFLLINNVDLIKANPQNYLNPTEYIFNSNIQKIKTAIENQFSNYKFNKMWLEKSLNPESIKIKEVFKKFKNNQNDFYLYSSGPIGFSQVYKDKNGHGLEYYATFYLRVTEIDSIKTKVEVITIDPMIVNGKDIIPSLPHLVKKDKFKVVPPSTIEEYEILLIIGKEVGLMDKMPKLNKPK